MEVSDMTEIESFIKNLVKKLKIIMLLYLPALVFLNQQDM